MNNNENIALEIHNNLQGLAQSVAVMSDWVTGLASRIEGRIAYMERYRNGKEAKFESTLCKSIEKFDSFLKRFKDERPQFLLKILLREEMKNTFKVKAIEPSEEELLRINFQADEISTEMLNCKSLTQILLERYPNFTDVIHEVFEISSPCDSIANQLQTEQSSELSK